MLQEILDGGSIFKTDFEQPRENMVMMETNRKG